MAWARPSRSRAHRADRIPAVRWLMVGVAVVLAGRLFDLQVIHNNFYTALAQDLHQLSADLYPARGQILVSDPTATNQTYPLATNKTVHLLYAIPKQVVDPTATATAIAPFVVTPLVDIERRLSKPNDLYEPIAHQLSDEQMAKIDALKLVGLHFSDESIRYYPEKNYGAHLLGFVGYQNDTRVGQYGLEDAFQDQLVGRQGFIRAEKDARGELIASAAEIWQPAVNGADLVLTIDRTLEYEACRRLDEAVLKHGADRGSLVILDPQTGAVKAMCGAPDFDPNKYSDAAAADYINPSTQITYEPGSVFKAITMAAALNENKVTPDTTYTDTGQVKIGSYTIKNSDGKANGVQSMTEVLEKSLNTGAIFAMQQVGPKKFAEYVDNFGFGQPTNVGIAESAGNVSSLESGKEIYAMTASFGQGITVTPLQLGAAFSALANGGNLMRPYVVDRIKRADGTATVTAPKLIRQVISAKTAATVSGMLVRVVQNGHGKKAGVPGYFVAGKTGTAQIPDPDRGGYMAEATIGTFAGFAPIDNPKFVMVVQIVHPRDVQFAESSAAPLFGQLARFILSYYHVPPDDPTTAP